MQSDGFRALHVSRSGQFLLPVPPDRAFPYFSPEGERAWAPGWEPEYLHPADGPMAPGMVFRTAAGGEPTLWLVSRWDPVRSRSGVFQGGTDVTHGHGSGAMRSVGRKCDHGTRGV